MVSTKEVSAAKLNAAVKEELKKIEQIQAPDWISYAKSGSHRERPPEQPDFWYMRSASVLRRIYLDGPVGTDRLRTYYGGRKRRGTRRAKFRKSSGSVIRKILQQLESAGMIQKDKDGKGRVVTSKGQKFIDNIAHKVSKAE
jgi:small subunit ribosomal protein S19e